MERVSSRVRAGALVGVAALVASGGVAAAATGGGDVPRMPDGRPDLSGTYDTATLTPLQRPERFGDKLFLTDQEADAIAAQERAAFAADATPSDPNREAPPVGGDGSEGAAGNVGGYNTFWVDRGSGAFRLDGHWRTSIVIDPPNGRQPPMTAEARQRFASRLGGNRQNRGDAWWLEREGPGPYDDPEQRPLGERCLLGFGSTAGPPALPVLYNNVKRIVQTADALVIVTEMNHDARVIRLAGAGEHDPPELRKWLGDSVGRWDGDTLVVETRHFGSRPALAAATESLRVTERFTRVDRDTLRYHFTVEDPSTWTAPWSGEYPWVSTADRLYEYACHEGNYALGNILRGARLLESEAFAARRSGATGSPEP